MHKVLYTRKCIGGPLNGQEAMSRFPKGFLLVDKPTNRVWIYDLVQGEGLTDPDTWKCREPEEKYTDIHWYTFDPKRGRQAANEFDYDVVAYDNDN
jgi:hypothetical protein